MNVDKEKFKNSILLESIFIFCIFLKYIVQKNFIFNQDADILWHIRQGEWYIDNLKIKLDKEIFSYLFEYIEWIYISWLADIIDALNYKIFGLSGIVLFYTIIFYTAIYIIFKYSLNKGVSFFSLFLSFIFLFQMIDYNFAVRTYIYSCFFLVVWYIIINEYLNDEKESKKIYILIPLQLIWVNIHSTFIYGFIMFFLFLIGSIVEWKKNVIKFNKIKKLFVISFICFVISFINPFGVKIYYFLYNHDFSGNLYKMNYEFMPFNFNDYPSILFIFAIISFIMIFNVRKIKTWDIFLLCFWMYLTIQYRRNMTILGIIAFLILPPFVDVILKKYKKVKDNKEKDYEKNKKINYIPIFSIFYIIILFWNVKTNILFDSKIYIVNNYYVKGAIEYIKKENIEGRIMNDYNIGSYLIWEFYPRKIVFFDSRGSIYPKEIYEDLRKVYYFEKETPKILKKYEIDYVLFSKKLEKGIDGLKKLENAKLIYEDRNSVLIKIEK